MDGMAVVTRRMRLLGDDAWVKMSDKVKTALAAASLASASSAGSPALGARGPADGTGYPVLAGR